jgi:hypothetical protein
MTLLFVVCYWLCVMIDWKYDQDFFKILSLILFVPMCYFMFLDIQENWPAAKASFCAVE